MREDRAPLGLLIAALGAVALALSVFAPWFAVRYMPVMSAYHGMWYETLVLWGLAGVAFLASVLRLAGTRGLLMATGGQITLVGGLAFAVVFARILWRPGAGTDMISISVSWGSWLALLSSIAIVSGGLLAGSDRASTRPGQRIGPGPPPLGRDVASPNALARPRR